MARRTRTAAVAKAAANSRVLAGYLRLTEDRNGDKIGYEIQKRKILQWADAYGYTIGHWYMDKDLTAADRNVTRPEYEQMLRDVEAGRWAGIVVWRLDRLVRLTREFERCYGVVEDAGGFIVSIDPMFNTKDDIGKFVMRLLVMLAEMEIAAMKARARAHQSAKAAAGKPGGGSRPFGFVGAEKDSNGNLLNASERAVAHNQKEVELLREAARRIAYEGETYADVIADWSTRNPPVLGTNGSVFQTTVLRQVLTSPRMIGKRSHTTLDPETGQLVTRTYDAEWLPILSREAYDRLLALRKVRKVNGRPHGYLLSGGLVVCARCQKRMVGTTFTSGSKKVRGYRCEASVTARMNGHCGKGTISAEAAENLVLASVIQRLERAPQLLDVLSADETEPDSALGEALATIEDCEQRSKAAGQAFGRRLLSEDALEATLEEIDAIKRQALQVVEQARAIQSAPVPIGVDRDDLRQWFDGESLSRQRAFLARFVRSVEIAPPTRRGSHFDPLRVRIAFRDAEEVGRCGE